MICRFHPRRDDRRRAAAAVELAILLPFLAFLFVVAVDFCRVFYFSLTLTNCARNGALYASDPVTAAQSPYPTLQAAALADASNLTPQPTVTSTTGVDGGGRSYVEVTATYPFQTITNYPGITNTLLLTRTVRMESSPVLPNFP